MSLQLTNLLPVWLIWFLLAVLLALLGHGTVVLLRKKIAPRWVMVLGGLRLAILVVFLAILFQPVLAFRQASEQLPELVVLVDTSKSMARPGGKGSRLEEVLASLRNQNLLNALGERYRLHWFGFDSTAYPLEESRLSGLEPAGTTTHFAESLTAAWNHLRAAGAAPERVVLVSDGNDLGKTDPVETARSLGVAIDTLGPSPGISKEEASRIAIADVQCARRVLLGSETHFRATLNRNSAARDQNLTLRLTEDGKKVWDQDLEMKAGQSERHVTLAHRPATTGTKEYAFQILAGGKAEPFPVTVQVLDSKYETLILEDTWRWDFKYLRRLFEDDPSFRFTAFLSRGKTAFMQFGSPDRRVNLVGFPQGRGELEGFDLFILGDVNPGRWPSTLPAALARLVAEEGKSLVVLAGPNLARLAEVPELHRLLPVELTTESGTPVTGPVAVRIRSDGGSFFFQIKPDAQLPPLDQIYPPLRKRPAAAILLEAAKHANSYGKLIVMAEHTVGKGRVLFIGTDTLWKWHTLASGDGPTPYSQFWQQALRALTPGRSLQGNSQLWLQASRTRLEAGRPVTVQAEMQSSRPLGPAKIQATVELPDKHLFPLAFAADPANPKQFRAEFESPLAGPHTIKATLIAEGKPLAEGMTVVHMEEVRGEQNDRGIDQANLARIAVASGGKVLDPERPETWPAPEDRPRPVVSRERVVDLWSNFTLIVVLCALLGIDWVIRIMKGFV